MDIIYKPSYFFIYDYETFGINPASDRPAQFAGIHTDHMFNPIGKEKIFWCQPPYDYLPNPKSVLTTNITPQNTLRNGLIETEFAHNIFQAFTDISNTCIFGYNNIHFDDEFSRHIFYRNFHDPYIWSYQKGNSRWDLLPILRACYSLFPKGIRWPLNSQKKTSFRLHDITCANGITHINAHNAISDVYATLELAKLIQNAQPKLFQFLYNHRTKYQLKKIINLHNTDDPLIHITRIINNKYNDFINLIVPIAWHPTNPNILITCNLHSNLEPILTLDIKSICYKLNHNHIKINDIFTKIPLNFIRLNACPILLPISFFNNSIHNHSAHINKILNNRSNYIKTLQSLRKYSNTIHFKKKICELITVIESYSYHHTILNKMHVDNQLYCGFFNNTDRKIIKNIRDIKNPDQLKILSINSSDTRLEPLFFFYRARNFPNTLNHKEKQQWVNYRKKTLLSQNHSQSYYNQLNTLYLTYQNDIQKIKLINSLKQYYKYLHKITM